MTNLEARAKQIQESGDFLLINALQYGKLGNPSFQPNGENIEAYRLGINIFFKRIGIDSLISAEQITQPDTITLHEGFFKLYKAIESGPIKHQEAEFDRDRYQRTLDQYAGFYGRGVIQEKEYMDFSKGALIALNVWAPRITKWREGPFLSLSRSNISVTEKQDLIEGEIDRLDDILDDISSLRQDILKRVENPTTYMQDIPPKENLDLKKLIG